MISMQQVLVTGGSGYIGSHLVPMLVERDCQVTVFDLVAPSLPNPSANYLLGDITALNWEGSLVSRGFDIVIHLAAKTSALESVKQPEFYRRTNAEASRSVWQFARSIGARRILYASSAAVYGDLGLVKAREDAPPSPASPYGETKLEGEQTLFSIVPFLHCYSLRLFNVGGGDDRRNLGEPTVLHALKQAKDSGSPFVINGRTHPTPDGTPVRDFVSVLDVAAAFVHFALSPQAPASGIYNIGSGTGVSIKELADKLSVPVVYGPIRPGDISYSVADIDKARLGGWQPTHSLSGILP